MITSSMEPFYFGPRRLFGVYEPPAADTRPARAVLLCYPWGQEYIRSHRAFVLLSRALAASGFHVLRFDFGGCGDSAGAAAEWDLDAWADDLRVARDELMEGSGAESICVLGLRLGASIALRAAEAMGQVDAMVLWEPVFRGDVYLAELRESHHDWLRGSFARADRSPDPDPDHDEDLLGFSLPRRLARQIEGLALDEASPPPASRVLQVYCSDAAPEVAHAVHARWRTGGVASDVLATPAPRVWLKEEGDLRAALVPAALLRTLVDWVAA